MLYNPSNKESIEEYARLLLGKNLSSALGLDFVHRFNNKASKGRLGQVVEEEYFGYKVNSRKEADFKEAAIELKVAPLKEIKPEEDSDSLREKQGISAKERVVLSIIDFMKIHKEQWSSNSLFDKYGQLLLMFYLNEKDKPIEELIFKIVNVWSPSEEDFIVINSNRDCLLHYQYLKGACHLSKIGNEFSIFVAMTNENFERLLRNVAMETFVKHYLNFKNNLRPRNYIFILS